MADTPGVPLASPEETAAQAADQAKEYGTWVAKGPIFFNGALAYNPGDPVPVTNVERYRYDEQDLVAKIDSKAGQDFIKSLHEAATSQQAVVEIPPPTSLGVQITDKK